VILKPSKDDIELDLFILNKKARNGSISDKLNYISTNIKTFKSIDQLNFDILKTFVIPPLFLAKDHDASVRQAIYEGLVKFGIVNDEVFVTVVGGLIDTHPPIKYFLMCLY